MQSPDIERERIHSNIVEAAPMGTIQKYQKSDFSGQDTNEINSLDKVRDILFGNQMREVEKRFARLEEHLINESFSLREETKKRLDVIENYLKQEVESLSERLKNEQGSRNEALTTLTEDSKKITTALEKKLTQFDEQVSNNQRELREQILSQSKNLQDDIHQKYQEMLSLLQREADELRHAKTDRSTLANLLSELAIRLNSQPQ
jgi:DNA anti-recombination protein RmuC